jgi:ABC-type amino acid transport substrate-binding protein
VAVSKDNEPLRRAIDVAQACLRDNGTLPRLVKTWLQA